MDLMEAEGKVLFPDPSSISLLDHDVVLEDFRDQMSEDDMQIIEEPFGEVQMRLIKPEESEMQDVESPEDIREILQEKIGNATTEHMVAVYMEGDNDVLGTQTVAKGGVDSVDFSPRQIVQAGIMMNASSVIIAHNHPSGALEFTQQDREASIDLEAELQKFDIRLLDMVLVTSDGNASMKEMGEGAFI